MKATGALLLGRTATLSWEILFHSLQDFSAFRCNTAGIPAIFNATFEQEVASSEEVSLEQLSPQEKEKISAEIQSQMLEHILVLEWERLFITPEEMQESLRYHKKQPTGITLLSRTVARGENHTLTGWYTVEAFLQALFHQSAPALSETAHYPVENGGFVSTAKELALASEYYRRQIIDRHREAGVHIPLDHGVMIGPKVQIGAETTVLPGTLLKGSTTIGDKCELGPNTEINESTVGQNCKIKSSVVDRSMLEDGVTIGPMANLRYDCHIKEGAKIGDFVELKNATIGQRTAVAHLTYLGDCTVGSDCNFGCGATIVNYDGNKKYHTTIGNGVFIGCNCSMVAPLTIGDGAYTAAGSVITQDVPADAMAIARSHQTIKEGWAKERGLFRKEKP